MKMDKEYKINETAAPAASAESGASEPMPAEDEVCEIVGVRFRDGGKVYYFAPGQNRVNPDDPVIVDGDYVLGVRPEFIRLTETGIEGEIYGAMPTGMESTLKIRTGEFLLTSVVFGDTLYAIGSAAHISFVGNSIMLFDRKSGRYITSGSVEI